MSYNYNEDEHKRNVLAYLFVAGMVFVACMATLLVLTWNEEQTKRDRIAVCVQSDDVVGCLKEAQR